MSGSHVGRVGEKVKATVATVQEAEVAATKIVKAEAAVTQMKEAAAAVPALAETNSPSTFLMTLSTVTAAVAVVCAIDIVYAWTEVSKATAMQLVLAAVATTSLGVLANEFLRTHAITLARRILLARPANTVILGVVLVAAVSGLFFHWWTPEARLNPREITVNATLRGSPGIGDKRDVTTLVSIVEPFQWAQLSGDTGIPLSLRISLKHEAVHYQEIVLRWWAFPPSLLASAPSDSQAVLKPSGPLTFSLVHLSSVTRARSLINPDLTTKEYVVTFEKEK